MKKIILKEADLKLFYEFARLGRQEQAEMLKRQGIYVDSDSENGQTVNLYYLNGFFVEEITNKKQGLYDIIPYKQGYRVESYFELRSKEEYKQAS